jgi:hypothetical protein
MSVVWKTKYGPRRVKHDPPTLDEAIFAARGLTDDVDQQVEIAASLMEMPVDEVRAAILKAGTPRKTLSTIAFTSTRAGAQRAVVVERKPARRVLTKTPGAKVTLTKTFGSSVAR